MYYTNQYYVPARNNRIRYNSLIQPAYQGYVQPAYQEYVQPAYQGYVQPAYQEYVQPAYQEYVQPAYQPPVKYLYQEHVRPDGRQVVYTPQSFTNPFNSPYVEYFKNMVSEFPYSSCEQCITSCVECGTGIAKLVKPGIPVPVPATSTPSPTGPHCNKQ